MWGHLNLVWNSAVQRYKLGIPVARDTWGSWRTLPAGPKVAHITPAFLPGRASLILRWHTMAGAGSRLAWLHAQHLKTTVPITRRGCCWKPGQPLKYRDLCQAFFKKIFCLFVLKPPNKLTDTTQCPWGLPTTTQGSPACATGRHLGARLGPAPWPPRCSHCQTRRYPRWRARALAGDGGVHAWQPDFLKYTTPSWPWPRPTLMSTGPKKVG